MSSTNSLASQEKSIKMTLRAKSLCLSSSEDPPMDEWSSLFTITPPDSPKMALYKQGLYDPGSGEVCAKYVRMSDSSVLRHHYYAYPAVTDPGILNALTKPYITKTYPLDGQELYLDLCEEMKVIPVRCFHRDLLKKAINLKFYGVNPVGVRAMSLALLYNRHVRRLDLTSNFLDNDACYHLGQMIGENIVLQELILSGCRIGVEGMRRLAVFLSTRTMETLDLSRNELGDAGFEHLAHQLNRGAVIRRLNLSYNELGNASAMSFAVAIEGNKSISYLDLSWNKLVTPKGVNDLLGQFSESTVLLELNLSWNALKINKVLRKLLTVPTLKILDLSNNRLTKEAANAIVASLQSAKGLRTLDLSYNPLSPEDAFKIVNKLRTKRVKLTNLLMDNVSVNRDFVKERNEVLNLSYRKNCVITFGEVLHDYTTSLPDIRDIIFKRLDFITVNSKKCHLDIAIYFLQKKKYSDFIQPREILRDMKINGAPIDEDLVLDLADCFPGPKLEKSGKTLDLCGIVEYIQRLWPDKKLPPTPPPEPEPEPVVPEKTKKKK